MHLEQAKVIPNRTDDLKINDDDVLFMICLSWTVEELFIAEQVQVVEICKFATKKRPFLFICTKYTFYYYYNRCCQTKV